MTDTSAQRSAAPTSRTGAVIIPALNEARAIRNVVVEALRYCELVIVVDDGSDDGTSASINDLPIQLLRHDQPEGKARALCDGFSRALELGYSGVLTMDGDGQHDAADLPRLLAAAAQYPGHIVIGARLVGKDAQPGKNRFGNQQADFWVSWLCGQRIVDTQSGQRYYPRAVMELALTLPREGFVFESEILIESANRDIRTVSVPIKSSYADDRRASHFKPFRDATRIGRMVAGRLFRAGFMPRNYWHARNVPPIVLSTAMLSVDESKYTSKSA